MTSRTRFDLKMGAAQPDTEEPAAALTGSTMAGFVRAAAKEVSLALFDGESRVTPSQRDFAAFSSALDRAFAPNQALSGALADCRARVRCALKGRPSTPTGITARGPASVSPDSWPAAPTGAPTRR